MDQENEVRDLKRRVDLVETKLAQIDGRFGFISGQLRDVQLYMHGMDDKIETLDQRVQSIDRNVETLDRKISTVDQKVDALPRVLADMLADRD